MRVVGVDFVDQSAEFDQQAVIYFDAPGRVDFRLLLVDLARGPAVPDRPAPDRLPGRCGDHRWLRRLRTRAVLRRDGPAKRTPLSLRLARNQDLPNNPASCWARAGG